MQSIELPLVLFTVLSQAAIGVTLMGAVRSLSGGSKEYRNEWRMVAAFMAVGLIASLFHLGHPEGAPNAISHLGKAWLSREVLAAGAFMLFAVLGVFLSSRNNNQILMWACVVSGLAVVFSAGMTYAPPAFPALNNALPATFFLISAVMLGAGFASWFATRQQHALLARIFTVTIILAVLLNLIAPCIWLSGGTVMRMTAQAWLRSGFYWSHLGVLIISLGILWKNGTIPNWLPLLVLAGELLGRAGFFADTIHAAMNMGGMY